ncbi:hypothetical protein B296_00056204 [Ensete ventricosum]|uniref:Uncharacterized protein n=1 Tax=Ensete ventricosum TaxID=4639 RepID=A0A426X3P5_ENSVE|nr:hypothetical protein B296_00056204 [Ensete ventricosum]
MSRQAASAGQPAAPEPHLTPPPPTPDADSLRQVRSEDCRPKTEPPMLEPHPQPLHPNLHPPAAYALLYEGVRRLLGTSGAPLASSDGLLVASSAGISCTLDGERDSARGVGVGVVAGVEETILEHPPPTLGLSRIKLMLTISAKPTMSWKIR